MSENHNREQDIQIAEIKTDVKWIRKEIDNIRDNHLKSIWKELDSQKSWLIATLTTILLTLIGVILNLVL